MSASQSLAGWAARALDRISTRLKAHEVGEQQHRNGTANTDARDRTVNTTLVAFLVCAGILAGAALAASGIHGSRAVFVDAASGLAVVVFTAILVWLQFGQVRELKASVAAMVQQNAIATRSLEVTNRPFLSVARVEVVRCSEGHDGAIFRIVVRNDGLSAAMNLFAIGTLQSVMPDRTPGVSYGLNKERGRRRYIEQKTTTPCYIDEMHWRPTPGEAFTMTFSLVYREEFDPGRWWKMFFVCDGVIGDDGRARVEGLFPEYRVPCDAEGNSLSDPYTAE